MTTTTATPSNTATTTKVPDIRPEPNKGPGSEQHRLDHVEALKELLWFSKKWKKDDVPRLIQIKNIPHTREAERLRRERDYLVTTKTATSYVEKIIELGGLSTNEISDFVKHVASLRVFAFDVRVLAQLSGDLPQLPAEPALPTKNGVTRPW